MLPSNYGAIPHSLCVTYRPLGADHRVPHDDPPASRCESKLSVRAYPDLAIESVPLPDFGAARVWVLDMDP